MIEKTVEIKGTILKVNNKQGSITKSEKKGKGGARSNSGRKIGPITEMRRIALAALGDQAETSMGVLVHLRDHALSEGIRFAAAKEIKDTFWGRPAQAITGPRGGPIEMKVGPMAALELVPEEVLKQLAILDVA